MKIFIEIPSWLGDAIMATPAIQNLIKTYPEAKIILLGSFVSTQAFKDYPNIEKEFEKCSLILKNDDLMKISFEELL